MQIDKQGLRKCLKNKIVFNRLLQQTSTNATFNDMERTHKEQSKNVS